MNLHFSPKKWVDGWKERLGRAETGKVITLEKGVIRVQRECMRYGEIAETYLKTEYHQQLFLDFLEDISEGFYNKFKAGEIDQQTFFTIGEVLKNISEHPYRLIDQGQKAATQLREWDEQGLTEQVAAADATFAQGG